MKNDSHLIFEAYRSRLLKENKLKYTYEIVAYLPRNIDISTREGQDKVLNLAHKELVKRVTNKYKNPERAASNMFYDEDFPMELVSQYSHYQKHGFPNVNAEEAENSLANSMCIEDLAKKHGVSLEDITKQLEVGLKIETEHTDNMDVAKKIAMDHLAEDPHYYTKLAKMEKGENAEDSAEDKMRDRENERDEKRRDAEVSPAFHYDPMSGLTKAANQIKDILHGAANDEARTEHIIKMAQIILGNPKEHTPAEYRKMLDGLIVLLNRFIVVPMNEYEEMPAKQFMNLKQFINKGPIKIKKPSKELPSTHSKIHDLAKQDSREGQREENAENSNTNMIVSHFRKTFGPGEKERMIKNNIDPYEFFVDYYSWMRNYDPKILSNFAEIYNSQYPDHKVDTKKLLNMFQAIKDVPLKGYQAPGKKSENEERRLDPKCWKGYHKQGTKLKDGKRVNNCVKNS